LKTSLSGMANLCKVQSTFIDSAAAKLFCVVLTEGLDSIEVWNQEDSTEYLM